MRRLTAVLLIVALCGCKKEGEGAAAGGTTGPAPEAAKAANATGPATEEGAKAMLSAFLKPGADLGALSLKLKPTSADYRAVFATEELAQKAETKYAELWEMVKRNPIAPRPAQTEILLWSATTDDLKQGTGNATKFPGGYKRVAAMLKPGLTVFRWKFVKPGETLGMAFDGLYNLGGRWVLMPKPWRIAR